MPLKYNFAFKNSKLKEWEKIVPSTLLSSDASYKTKIIYLYQIFIRNPKLFYPPGSILILTLIIHLVTLYPANIINRLESRHFEYTKVSQQISQIKSRFNKMKQHLVNIKPFYAQATPSYLFVFYLQNAVPQGVQLNEYFVNDNGFDITASAYGIEPLNQMVTLLRESPIVNKKSLSIKKIDRSSDSGSGKKSNVVLEIEGNILKLNMDKRELLYEESLANGLLRKLLRYKTLNRFIRS